MLKLKFEQIKHNNSYMRFDSEHPLEIFIGKDENGLKCIEYRGNFKITKLTGTDSIQVNHYDNCINKHTILRFSLSNEEMNSIFFTFCYDLIESTKDINNDNAYKKIIERFQKWRTFFLVANKKILSENQIIGLIGELLFIKDILSIKLGYKNSLDAWSGQELTHKDFSFGDSWYEIKTQTTNDKNLSISSLQQLKSDNIGYLIVYSIEKMSRSFNGISLNKLFFEICNQINDIELKNLFLNKVSLQGYSINDQYDEFVYSINNVNIYKVNDSFPKLTTDLVDNSIISASYKISNNSILKFKVDDIEVNI